MFNFKIFSIYAIVLFFSYTVLAKTLDEIITVITENSHFDPLVTGKSKSKKHPQYNELLDLAEKFNTEVSWAPSVAKEVLKMPFHSSRMVVKSTDKFDGWFDEYTNPNKIILSSKAAFIILIHEIRHAIQLGTHGLIEGSEFDQILQKNKISISQFQKNIDKSNLTNSTKTKLKMASTKLIETASEISAHQGDVVLSKAFDDADAAETYVSFIEEYEDEFKQSYLTLKANKISSSEFFVNDLYKNLTKFMTEKNLKIKFLN